MDTSFDVAELREWVRTCGHSWLKIAKASGELTDKTVKAFLERDNPTLKTIREIERARRVLDGERGKAAA